MAAGTVTADGRARVLADGNEIPLLGLGVWQVPDGPECEDAVRWALEAGYRHVDTAQADGNEPSVGRALRDSGLPREDVFVTTRFYPGRRDPEAALQRSLEAQGLVEDWRIEHNAGGLLGPVHHHPPEWSRNQRDASGRPFRLVVALGGAGCGPRFTRIG